MSLEKMLAAQKALDERIVKEKGLEGKDLVANTYVALDVELGEMANEARWFKHWSNDQKPRKESLLEEYVDALHFFLSIAIQKGWEDALYLHEGAILDVEDSGFQGGLTEVFLEMKYFLINSLVEKDRNKKFENAVGCTKQEYNFRTSWFLFVAIGLVGFGFTLEQIEQAYFKKNKVNHERQDNGY